MMERLEILVSERIIYRVPLTLKPMSLLKSIDNLKCYVYTSIYFLYNKGVEEVNIPIRNLFQ